MRKSKLRWWNAPQYRSMVNGFLGFVTVRLFIFFYDLAGLPQAYRSYVLWSLIGIVGVVLLLRFYKLKKLRPGNY